MIGKEQLIASIREEAEQSARKKREEAQRKAVQLLEQAKESAEAEGRLLLDKALQQADRLRQNARSAAAMEARGLLLTERRRLIAETLEETRRRLLSLPDDVYFQMISRWIAASAESKTGGTLVFGERDRQRLPAGFLDELRRQPRCEDLRLAERTGPLDGGVLLCYGDIEINLSLAALMEARREELEDRINRALFSEGYVS
ncbi:MAG: hypothetical protein HFJ79_00850 [Clostridiales bacterium]|nr:hypothetical protein [Clostridiales bacterium]